MNRINHK